MTRHSSCDRRRHSRLLRRLGHIESLEQRSVLSVCGVTCGLADGVLSVQGTAANDDIAVRYDANTASLSVVGKDNELIGQFPVAEIRGLYINGLGGNDHVEVDSQIQQSLAATGNFHVHGASLPTVTPTLNPALANYGPILSANFSTGLSSTQSSTVTNSTNLTSAIDHGSHGSTAPDSVGDAHVHDGASVAVSLIPAVSGAIVQAHIHASAGSMPSSAAENGVAHLEGHSDEALDSDAEMHGRHTATSTTNVAFSKLVAKPCTVSYSGGVLVTSVDGKRQCDCEAKQRAADEIAQQLAAGTGSPAVSVLSLALANCTPCQQSALLAGMPTGLAVCSLTADPAAMLLPDLAPHTEGSCPAKASVGAEDEASEAPWLGGVQLIGWTLLGTAVAALPMRRARRDDEETIAKDHVRSADWLFGSLDLELLAAR